MSFSRVALPNNRWLNPKQDQRYGTVLPGMRIMLHDANVYSDISRIEIVVSATTGMQEFQFIPLTSAQVEQVPWNQVVDIRYTPMTMAATPHTIRFEFPIDGVTIDQSTHMKLYFLKMTILMTKKNFIPLVVSMQRRFRLMKEKRLNRLVVSMQRRFRLMQDRILQKMLAERGYASSPPRKGTLAAIAFESLKMGISIHAAKYGMSFSSYAEMTMTAFELYQPHGRGW